MQSTIVSCEAESAAQCSYAKSFLFWWDGSESDDSLKEFCSNIFRLQSCRLVWLQQWKQWRRRNRDIIALEWKPLHVWLDLRYIAVYRLCPPPPLPFLCYTLQIVHYTEPLTAVVENSFSAVTSLSNALTEGFRRSQRQSLQNRLPGNNGIVKFKYVFFFPSFSCIVFLRSRNNEKYVDSPVLW
jgi:hypothetical protein